uniref:Uncharacterized protein n=1 Tax=Arundo donax TaxID=35708 RepID=A0A0A9F234_ARUDO
MTAKKKLGYILLP